MTCSLFKQNRAAGDFVTHKAPYKCKMGLGSSPAPAGLCPGWVGACGGRCDHYCRSRQDRK